MKRKRGGRELRRSKAEVDMRGGECMLSKTSFDAMCNKMLDLTIANTALVVSG